jgi:SP family myo-inositol transporter-like MFS transporter 13
LVIAAVSFSYIPINLKTLEVESDDIGWPGMLLIVVIIIFVACFSSGVATIAWICKSHLPIQHASSS